MMQFACRCCKSLFPDSNVTGAGLGSNKAAGVRYRKSQFLRQDRLHFSAFHPLLHFHLFNLSRPDNCSAAEGKHVNGSRGSNCDTVGGFVSVHSRMEHMTLQT